MYISAAFLFTSVTKYWEIDLNEVGGRWLKQNPCFMKFRYSALPLFLFLLLILTPVACKKDADSIPLANVQDDFKMYVNRFVAEANARNVPVDISKLIVEFTPQITLAGAPYCGQALSSNPPHVQITNSTGCWTNQSDTNKEILIFHELGHALLSRSHLDDNFSNGMWKSMMHSGNQFNMYSEYTPALRKYYIDELFNVNTPAPDFSKPKTNSVIVYQDSISKDNVWLFYKVGSPYQQGTTTSTDYVTAGHALQIVSTQGATNADFSYFEKVLSPNGIAAGSELTLKAKVKTKELINGTATVVLRVDYQGKQISFVTTQGSITIAGNQDFKEFPVTVSYFPEHADKIYVFFVLTGPSVGTAIFDDVQVVNSF
jgi:hypothetical protein